MIGNWRWNAAAAAAFALIIFMISIMENIIITSIVRSAYSFFIMFGMVFIFRWLLGTVVGLKSSSEEPLDPNDRLAVDVTTPDETETIRQMLKSSLQNHAESEEQSFSPMNPPRLISKKVPEPEHMAHAVRHMLEDEGR